MLKLILNRTIPMNLSKGVLPRVKSRTWQTFESPSRLLHWQHQWLRQRWFPSKDAE